MKAMSRTLCAAASVVAWQALAQGLPPQNSNGPVIATPPPGLIVATPPDPDPAMNNPDKDSWQLFIQVNAPAATAGNNNVLFETWATDDDTFTASPVWPTVAPVATLKVPALVRFAPPRRGPNPFVIPMPPGQTVSEEVRRNKVSFDFIVDHKLFTRSGLKQAFAANQPIIFPVDSIEVKANWVRASTVNASLYHVNTASDGQQYALVSMHIISKQIPNWTWATFEHMNNLGRCDFIGCRDNFGATDKFVGPKMPIGGKYPACGKTQALKDMFTAAKLEAAYDNYCLKGSQVDFTTATGLPNLLGNSVTENGFVPSSSCMTCHSRASVNSNGADAQDGGFLPSGQSPNGTPVPSWFWNNPSAPNQSVKAFPMDFVWAIPLFAISQ
jgi:hypothetical protein